MSSRNAKPLKKGQVFSLLEMASLLGVNRGTLARWLEEEDCPHVSRPVDGVGSWELSAPDVIRWYVDRSVAQAVEKTSGGHDADIEAELDAGLISIEEAKRRKAVADARIREIDLDRSARSVVPISDIAEIVGREYAAVREGVLGLGPRVAPRIVGQTEAAVVAEEIRSGVDEILSALQADQKTPGGN